MANDRRLIDANACLHDMCKRCNIENEGCPCEPADCFICNVLEDSTTVDTVEVVLCKDCKSYAYMGDGLGDCTNERFHLDGHTDPTMKPDDFCSLGERRENGQA